MFSFAAGFAAIAFAKDADSLTGGNFLPDFKADAGKFKVAVDNRNILSV